MAGLSTLSIAVLIGGIAVFIIILAVFIVWKVRYENRSATPRRPSPSPDLVRSRSQDSSVPAMTIADPRESVATTTDSPAGLDANSNSNNGKPAGKDYYNVPIDEDTDSTPPMTTFASSNQVPRSTEMKRGATVFLAPTAPPVPEDRSTSSHTPAQVRVDSATQQQVYSHLGENKTSEKTSDSPDEYDNSAFAKQSQPDHPGTYFLSQQPGSNSSQQQKVTEVYSFASPIGNEPAPDGSERQGEGRGGPQAGGSGEYFELEQMNRPGSGSSATDNYFVLERQESDGTAKTDNVYVELEDGP